MTTQREFITRKDIAARLGMSVKFVRNNEARLGFLAAKVVLSSRCIRYRASVVESVIASLPNSLGHSETNKGTQGQTKALR